jgi:hypothetical protein
VISPVAANDVTGALLLVSCVESSSILVVLSYTLQSEGFRNHSPAGFTTSRHNDDRSLEGKVTKIARNWTRGASTISGLVRGVRGVSGARILSSGPATNIHGHIG